MVELALLAVLVGGGAWYVLSRRQGLDEAARQLRSAITTPDGFDGAQATVLAETVAPQGDAHTGPWLRVSSVCRMPDGGLWQVVVETARTGAEARSTAQKVPPEAL